MDEPRTKLVCNLGMDDFFRYPGEEGVWRRTPDSRMIMKRKFYICRKVDDYNKTLELQGGIRVELIEKGE